LGFQRWRKKKEKPQGKKKLDHEVRHGRSSHSGRGKGRETKNTVGVSWVETAWSGSAGSKLHVFPNSAGTPWKLAC